ncbi:conserved hypothetical protein [Streptomyces sviceus ATCC 29083]|uniref:Uncharacterized protein n=1 Tax=Streptomyces sviceus (strain ATCC 29083 / DSM 924 / JCM 4929 / NBRC 13980 / NCIMB 11184 / NRRL 5439 / UC 5370) TaxID=463191 RepID=B5HPH5_STRX2|nr:conserved hypothetical protein [Streptomyces sviceus ATCC 29083]
MPTCFCATSTPAGVDRPTRSFRAGSPREVAQIVDAAAYAQAVQDATAYYEGALVNYEMRRRMGRGAGSGGMVLGTLVDTTR